MGPNIPIGLVQPCSLNQFLLSFLSLNHSEADHVAIVSHLYSIQIFSQIYKPFWRNDIKCQGLRKFSNAHYDLIPLQISPFFILIFGGGRVERRSWVNFQCRGVLLLWMVVGQGPIALAIGAGGGLFGHFFSHLSFLFSFSLSLGDGPI